MRCVCFHAVVLSGLGRERSAGGGGGGGSDTLWQTLGHKDTLADTAYRTRQCMSGKPVEGRRGGAQCVRETVQCLCSMLNCRCGRCFVWESSLFFFLDHEEERVEPMWNERFTQLWLGRDTLFHLVHNLKERPAVIFRTQPSANNGQGIQIITQQ